MPQNRKTNRVHIPSEAQHIAAWWNAMTWEERGIRIRRNGKLCQFEFLPPSQMKRVLLAYAIKDVIKEKSSPKPKIRKSRAFEKQREDSRVSRMIELAFRKKAA